MKNRVAHCGVAGAVLVIVVGVALDDPYPNHLAPTVWLGVFYLIASAMLLFGSRLRAAIGALGVALAAGLAWHLHFHPVTMLELCGAVLFLTLPMVEESGANSN